MMIAMMTMKMIVARKMMTLMKNQLTYMIVMKSRLHVSERPRLSLLGSVKELLEVHLELHLGRISLKNFGIDLVKIRLG